MISKLSPSSLNYEAVKSQSSQGSTGGSAPLFKSAKNNEETTNTRLLSWHVSGVRGLLLSPFLEDLLASPEKWGGPTEHMSLWGNAPQQPLKCFLKLTTIISQLHSVLPHQAEFLRGRGHTQFRLQHLVRSSLCCDIQVLKRAHCGGKS